MGINSLNNTITLAGRLFDTRQPVRPLIPDTSEKPPRRISPIRQPFPRCTPEEAGIPSGHIAAFLTEIAEDESLNMHSILILRGGRMITEAFFTDHDPLCWKCTFSACKSITSLAIGMLCDEGKLSVDEKLTDLFDNRIPPLARLAVKDLTVRHLLTMSTGSSFNEITMMTERDWVRGFFSGTFDSGKFAYNSLNTYLLSVILTEKTGESLSDYLKPRLFEPLGISNYYWEKSPSGIDKGGWGLYMRPEDLAKIGQFVMQRGQWNGRQLVSADWIDQAASKQISTGETSDTYDYGWQIWVGRQHDSFLFNGMLGQNVLGFRENGIILVSHAGNDELFQQSNYFALAEKYFSGNFEDNLPADDAEHHNLQICIDGLRDIKETGDTPKNMRFRLFRRKKEESASSLPKECQKLSGVRFDCIDENAPGAGLMPVVLQAVQNNYACGCASLSFLCSGEAFYLTYAEEQESYFLRIGFREAADSDLVFHGVPYHVKALGIFTHNEDGVPLLKIRINFCETPLTRTLKLYYTGAHPYLEQSERPGSPFISSKVLRIKRDLLSAPLIGDTLNLVDDDYLRYRIDKKFAPTLRLCPSQIIPRGKIFNNQSIQ